MKRNRTPSKYVTDREGPSRTHAYVILKGADVVGKIIAAYPRDGAGRVYATLWDWSTDPPTTQHGSASGYGYNKLASILSGMTFAGQPISEGGWERSIEERGFKVFCAV